MGIFLENQNNKLVCEMHHKNIYSLFNEINRSLYIKVLKRTKISAPLNSEYDDEIVIIFIV